jgi:opacity protein-like surface antigen
MSRNSAAAALGLLLLAPTGAGAADVSEYVLRGGFSSAPVRWDGVNFGATFGVTNMDADFTKASSEMVAHILRESTLESEASPSQWNVLPSSVTNGQTYGAFLGYNMQWDQLVLGFDLAYNIPSGLSTAEGPTSLERIVTTSDNVANDVTITSQASIKLVDYATFRLRAGYAFGQFLPYAFVGAAAGRFNYTNSATVVVVQTPAGGVPSTYAPPGETDNKNNAIVAGFVGGLGMDVALLPNVFLRGEWEYVGFAAVSGIRVNLNTARVGIGMRF